LEPDIGDPRGGYNRRKYRTDLAASRDGKFLYVINSNTGSIAGYQINGTDLTSATEVEGLPLSIQGIVAF
jgi:6-phosphogluconolactonase (cycloisomerase 2 family)